MADGNEPVLYHRTLNRVRVPKLLNGAALFLIEPFTRTQSAPKGKNKIRVEMSVF